MEAIITALVATNTALLGIAMYFTRKWMERIDEAQKTFGKSQTECQLTLARVYRTKAEAESDSTRQWGKIDDHGNRITRLETLMDDGK